MRDKSEYSIFERTLIVIFSFVFFAVIGFVFCVFLEMISVLPNQNSILTAFPFMLGFGLIAAVLAYRYPGVFNVILWFLP